jgi:hypothetical protein
VIGSVQELDERACEAGETDLVKGLFATRIRTARSNVDVSTNRHRILSQPYPLKQTAISETEQDQSECAEKDRDWVSIIRSSYDEGQHTHRQSGRHMYLEQPQENNRTEGRNHDRWYG